MKIKSILAVALFCVATLAAQNVTAVLEWDANSEADLAGYNVYRSDRTEDNLQQINADLVECEPNDTTCATYTDSTAVMGIDYWYAVTAVNLSGMESDFSNTVRVRRDNPNPPDPPTGLQVELSGAQARLKWEPVEGADQYLVMIRPVPGNSWFFGGVTESPEKTLTRARRPMFASVSAFRDGQWSEMSQPVVIPGLVMRPR